MNLKPYPAFKAGFFFAFGIYLGSLAALPTLLPVAGVFATSCLLLFGGTSSGDRWLTAASLLLLMFTGAACLTLVSRAESNSAFGVRDTASVLVGMVAGPPYQSGSQVRFPLEASHLVNETSLVRFGQSVFVSLNASDTSGVLRYGEIVALHGTLYRPPLPSNPGDFNKRRYYEASGIGWMFACSETRSFLVLDSLHGSWIMRNLVIPARLAMLREIDRSIGGQEGEYLKGVLLGERGGLSPEIREAFTLAGVAHILAVSGSNVAVVAAFAFFALELFRISRTMRVLSACALVIFYMLLVGFQPPVVRATIMAVVLLLGNLCQEHTNPVNSLGVASLIILGFEPRQLFDVGFQLSFLAVLSIVYLYPILDRQIRRIPHEKAPGRSLVWTLRVCAVSLVATLGTLPLTAVYFDRVSIIGLIANIGVIPAAGLSLLLGFVAIPLSGFSPWIADTYSALNQLVLALTLDLTVLAGSVSFASVDTPRFTAIDGLPFYALLLLIFHVNRQPLRRFFAILLLVAINLWIFLPGDMVSADTAGMLRVSFISVGQGDAALAELPDGKILLIDAGPKTFTRDAGEQVIVPFLRRQGVKRIDALIVSHPHSDHMGGVMAVLKAFDVGAVFDCGLETSSSMFRDYLETIQKEGCSHTQVSAGERLHISPSVRLYALSPPPNSRPANLNDASVVVLLLFAEFSVLFTGDAEAESEARMAEQYGDFLHAEILKVGHHGSRTSSTERFIQAVKPAIAVISVGRVNSYGHPSSETIRRFERCGVKVHRTDRNGAAVFVSDGEDFERIEWRD